MSQFIVSRKSEKNGLIHGNSRSDECSISTQHGRSSCVLPTWYLGCERTRIIEITDFSRCLRWACKCILMADMSIQELVVSLLESFSRGFSHRLALCIFRLTLLLLILGWSRYCGLLRARAILPRCQGTFT